MKLVETEKKKKDSKKLIEEEFKNALAEFMSNEDYFSEYDNFQPLGKKVLVKLFKFEPSKDLIDHLGKSHILVKSKLDGDWRPSAVAKTSKIFPIVKIIKKGTAVDDPNIQVGATYTVPYEEIRGESWNPDFLHLMNSFSQKAGNQGQLTNVPADMPHRLPNVEIEWKRYKFSMPDRLAQETDEDKLIYLLPDLKLESIYG